MARSAFETVIRLQLDKFSPEVARKKHIEIARKGLAAFMGAQQVKPTVAIETDGHPSASEEAVKPFGIIVYRFTRMREIAQFALDQAIAQSPERSGFYKYSWFAMIDGREVVPGAIPQSTRSITLTNDAPYARKINVRGARLLNVPPGIVERVRQLVLRRYGALVTVNLEYITLAGGYVLQKNGARASKSGRRSARKDVRKGASLTYPALTIASKF
jgi:hypothetical protein